jgi:hypothetical protein
MSLRHVNRAIAVEDERRSHEEHMRGKKRTGDRDHHDRLLTVYFGAPSMFITLWFGFDYGTNPPLGTTII